MSYKYKKPPIVEAILDIQVELDSIFDVEKLRKCQTSVKKDYPQIDPINDVRGELAYGPDSGASVSASSKKCGYRFTSPDKKQLFQVKLNGFTYNRLAPYDCWDVFNKEAQRLWHEYFKQTRPMKYKRVALRYINRFVIPKKHADTKDYFRTGPEISSDLPQVFIDYFFSVVVPVEPISGAARIISTLEKTDEPDKTVFLLDIDLFKTEELPSGDLLWPLFEDLRKQKNLLFESCMTPKARELLE